MRAYNFSAENYFIYTLNFMTELSDDKPLFENDGKPEEVEVPKFLGKYNDVDELVQRIFKHGKNLCSRMVVNGMVGAYLFKKKIFVVAKQWKNDKISVFYVNNLRVARKHALNSDCPARKEILKNYDKLTKGGKENVS